MSIQASSKFRRSGQRDERRRRLMADEGLADDAGSTPQRRRRGSRHNSAHYGDAEFLQHARRIVDLFPLRLMIVAAWLAAGTAAIAGIEALYAWMPQLAAGTPLAAFDLAAPGNLAGWFSALLLLAAAAAALGVYSIRRHRVDDYRGRYRVWLWTALCWFFIASDQAANLHQAMQQVLVRFSGTTLYGNGDLWWIIAYLLLLTAVGSRLLLDMWESRLATATLLLAAGAYLAAGLLRLEVVVCATAAQQIMVLVGTAMAGNLLVLLAMVLYARHVLLDAQGLLRKPRPARTKQPVDKAAKVDDNTSSSSSPPTGSADAKTLLVDPPHPTPAPQLVRSLPATGAAASANSADDDDDNDDNDDESAAPVNRKLTKAERKALKQRLLDQRRQRDQQQSGRWGR